MTIETTENKVQIIEYSVAEFVFKIEEYIKNGYHVSQDILGYPVKSGVAYYGIMLKDVESTGDNHGQVKKTRKAKES